MIGVGLLKDFVSTAAGNAAVAAAGLGKVGIDTLEKVSSATLESWQFYNDIGVRQLRALNFAAGPASARDFLRESTAVGTDLVARMVHDLQTTLTLATEMRVALENTLSSVTPPEPVATTRSKAVTKSTPV